MHIILKLLPIFILASADSSGTSNTFSFGLFFLSSSPFNLSIIIGGASSMESSTTV